MDFSIGLPILNFTFRDVNTKKLPQKCADIILIFNNSGQFETFRVEFIDGAAFAASYSTLKIKQEYSNPIHNIYMQSVNWHLK